MKFCSTKDLNVTFLGITPVLNDKTGVLNPQEIVSLSGLLTFKGKSIQTILRESLKLGENLNEKVQKTMLRSSLKGHASLATTPTLCFSFEASKFLDSALTGLTFASALMSSGRRTDIKAADIVFPAAILRNSKARKIYYQTSKKNIDFSNILLAKKVVKDEASKIIQYGVYGTGIIQLSVESIVSVIREYEIEKEWMPEEIGFLLEQMEKQLAEYGADFLYATRKSAPRDTCPYPNIFKDPKKPNMVRDLVKNKKVKDFSELVSANFLPTQGLKKKMRELEREIKKVVKNKKEIKNRWYQLLLKRRQIARDYNLAANVKILSRVPWRVWSEKKRHRTCPMVVESAYYCVNRAKTVFLKYQNQIENKKINDNILKEIEKVFSLPPGLKSNNGLLQQWLERALDSFGTYQKLIKLGIKERDAIFVIPRGLKIDVLQEYDLFNLISGYYPLRLCSTVEEELLRLTSKEVFKIKKLLKEKGLKWLAQHIAVKCHLTSFCPEKEFCGQILPLVRDYNEKLHQSIHQNLEKKLREKI